MCDVGHAVAYYGQSKDDIQEEGESMSNILAAKTILLRAEQNNTKPHLCS